MNKAKGNKKKSGVRGVARTSREDWVTAALDTLISEGVDSVKVLVLAEKLGCARSSFYWYFQNREDLLDALLAYWQETNTRALIAAANQPARSINGALGKLYSDWVSGVSFDTKLDFAIRDWARRSGTVRRALDISEAARIDAITGMFVRFGYPEDEASVRGRIVYFTQIGYATLDQRETWETRIARSKQYLFCMTGKMPSDSEIAALVKGTQAKLSQKGEASN